LLQGLHDMKIRFLALLALVNVAAALAQTGSLTFAINGRVVTMPLNTQVLIDDEPATLADLRYRPNGMQARWNNSFSLVEGVAATPIFSFTLIGPVTDSARLAVLGQPITITADTTLAGVAPPFTLPLGTPVVVAGLVDANGSILATLVERRGQPGARFLLTGQVQDMGELPGVFRIGDQWISAPTITFADCATPTPGLGEYVELRADAIANFPPGSVLDTVTGGRCVAPVPAGTAGAAGFLQGLISAVPTPDRFDIGSLAVNIGATTTFVFGAVDDLGEGVAVTVDGSYVDAHTFAATVVEFVRPVVRFEAPLTPANVVAGVSLSPFGVPMRWSAQVRDEDGILTNGLVKPAQVEVRGYLDRSGQAFATRVRNRGNADPNDVRLRGPVQAINNPMLTIQGLTVNTTGATFADEYGITMTTAQFFAAVQIDHQVDVSGSVFNAANSTLSGGAIVWIGAEPLRVAGQSNLNPPATGIYAGTAGNYAFIEPMFRSGFE
jgi:Domain of unknown function (DUF5666)